MIETAVAFAGTALLGPTRWRARLLDRLIPHDVASDRHALIANIRPRPRYQLRPLAPEDSGEVFDDGDRPNSPIKPGATVPVPPTPERRHWAAGRQRCCRHRSE